MSNVLTTIESGAILIISTIILGYLYINSDNKTRKIIAYSLYFGYTLWSTYGVWEVTRSTESILMWVLVCTIGFSFILFVFVENKLISFWVFYITILVNLLLLIAGIALTILGKSCEAELSGNVNQDDANKSKSRFYWIFGIIIFLLLIEGFNTIAFIVFIIAITLYNNYEELHIGDIIHCI